jgi:hypothetical protein
MVNMGKTKDITAHGSTCAVLMGKHSQAGW